MTPQDFVAALHEIVDSAVAGELAQLETPSGRTPWPILVERSEWWHSLSDDDRRWAASLIRVGAHTAVFSVLTTLDGAAGYLQTPGDSLHLNYVTPGGDASRLDDPEILELHAEFRGDGSLP